jgi:hypothetical protein
MKHLPEINPEKAEEALMLLELIHKNGGSLTIDELINKSANSGINVDSCIQTLFDMTKHSSAPLLHCENGNEFTILKNLNPFYYAHWGIEFKQWFEVNKYDGD